PLEFTEITSEFSPLREHPILRCPRPHLGVDFAAPPGRPVRAVASGTVVEAGWVHQLGRSVRVEHSGGLRSVYGHLRRIADGVREGMPVERGQVIGYVGSSGLSTGPHLHFALDRGGEYVDPLQLTAAPGPRLPESARRLFIGCRRPSRGSSPPCREAEARSPSPSPRRRTGRSRPTRYLGGPRPRLFAHRGASGLVPENTLDAFAAGLKAGAERLELDVHATADAVVVVLHDETLERTTDGAGAARALPLAAVERLDAGYRFRAPDGTYPYRDRGLRVPTLAALLEAFPGVPLNIEVKQKEPPIE